MVKNLKQMIWASAVASVVTSFAAQADVRLTVGGYIDGQIVFRSEEDRFEYLDIFETGEDEANFPGKRRGEFITHDSTVSFMVTGHTDRIFDDLKYGGLIVLEADTTASKYNLPILFIDTDSDESQNETPVIWDGVFYPLGNVSSNSNRNAREVMLFGEGMFGRVEVGNTYDATKKMQIDAGSVAAGNGGVHGDALLHLNPASGFGNFRTPDLYTNKMAYYHLDSLFLPVGGALPIATEVATAGKISYYSPNFNGFQLGLSYTIDTDITGTAFNALLTTEHASRYGFGFENVFSGGFTYDGGIGDFNFQFALLGQTGKAKAPAGDLFFASRVIGATERLEDLEGFEVGFATEFMGIGLAASYGYQEGLLNTLKENEYFTVGLGYEMGPWAFSVNYMDNRQESNVFLDVDGNFTTREAELSNLVFDIAYTCQGFMPYLSVAVFDFERPEYFTESKQENDGTVVLLGTKLEF